MWVLIGISVAVIAGFTVLHLINEGSEHAIPSIANPWQNLALRLVGVLVGTIILILWVFYT